MRKDIYNQAIKIHRKLKGKIAVSGKMKIDSQNDLSCVYTPGVGAVATYLAAHKDKTRDMTIKGNSVAIVSDGSAVLGLGNLGPEGAVPVMEGKAMIFKTFANIDAFPIVLATQDPDEIVATVKNIAPIFGGINLEDIAAPRCFEIERRLQDELDIPVMHDDQHGTAMVVLAGLINAFKVARVSFQKARIVIIGAGAAGNAITHLLLQYGARDVLLVDSKGIIHSERKDIDLYKKELAHKTNIRHIQGGMSDALVGADAVIGVSQANLLTAKHIRLMAKKSIVFAMSNPIPEIMPNEAKKGGAFIVATGRSDFQNQINNALCFPGIFRGALDHHVKKITHEMQIRAAEKLAGLIKNPTPSLIIPSLFDPRVVKAVANAIK